MIHTQSEIDNLVELAIIQRAELKKLVDSLPQLRDHLSSEIERNLEEIEPAIRSELEQLVIARALAAHAQSSAALTARVDELGKALEVTTAARYSVLMAEREQNATLLAQAEARIAEAASALPSAVKSIVTDELSRFPRAGEIDQLRKEFAEPKGLNPRGKWTPDETYQRLDLVTVNGDSFVSNIDGNRERPSRSAADWTLNAARGNSGGGGGVTSINDLLPVPSAGQILGSENSAYVPKNLVAGSNITITETPTTITITGDEGQIELQDGTAAAPSLFFVNDTDTGLFRVGANTLGIAVGGTQAAAISSAVFAITPNTTIAGTLTANGTSIPASKTLVVTTDKISVLAATSSAELAGVISDETGTGSLVFASSPTLVTPALGTPSALVGTNISGTAAGLTAGNVTTNANLTGDVTSVGNATSIAAGAILNADVNASAAIAYSKLNLATSIVNADISASAAIVDTKLATISTALKVSNSATTATSANTASAIVARDGSGNFTAGNITANLTGNVSGSSGSTTGNAATATALATARTIAITGDLTYTSPSFDGTGNVTAAGTLATVATAGSTGGSTAIPIVTINAKGLTTSITTAAVVAPAGTLSGNTLASGVTASSLTSLGTIASLTVTGGTISTTPSASTDIANKLYVDTVAQGLDAKASCVAATTADITLSGAQTIDGVSVVAGNRVLVKNQTLSQNNGIYLCASGAWTRTTDADTWDELTSAFTFIEQGTTNADCGFVCTANAGGTLGTTALPWSQFSGAGTFTAGTGLTLTGSVFSLTTPVAVANGGTGLTSLGAGVATFLGTPSSANLAAAVTDETGSGALVFASSPSLTTPNLGTPSAAILTSATGLPISTGVSGLGTGVATALAVNTGSAGAPVLFNGALGTPTSGTATNLTGTSGITGTGVLNSGSITSGFGSIDVGTDSLSGGTNLVRSATAGSTGANTGVSDCTSSLFRFFSVGADVSTNGGFQFYSQRSNDSNQILAGQITSTGLNSTAIGATTAAAGSFTTLGASGTVSQTPNAGDPSYKLELVSAYNGADSFRLKFAGTTYLRVNTNDGVLLAPSSLAVTGALSATGQVAIGTATASQDLVIKGAANQTLVELQAPNATIGGYVGVAGNAGTIFSGTAARDLCIRGEGSSIKVGFSNNAPVAIFSSNGLAITGNVENVGTTEMVYTGSVGSVKKNNDNTSGTHYIDFQKGNSGIIGSISRVTTTDAVAYNTTSDSRLKENLRDFTDSGRLIDSLKPRLFDWKNSDENGKNVIGFIAQEEHAADPIFSHIGAVSVGDEDSENITKQWQRSDSALIPILVAELKSVRARLAALESS